MKRGKFILLALFLFMAVFVAVAQPRSPTASPSAPSAASPFGPGGAQPSALPTVGAPPPTAAASPGTPEAPAPSVPVAPTDLRPAAPDLSSIPLAMGLPVVVRTGVYFAALSSLNEADKTFDATIDIRLLWRDPRLQFPREQAPLGYLEFRGAEATTKLQSIWSPAITIANIVGDPTLTLHGLRIRPDGRVELVQRTVARFATDLDLAKFPFDRQTLRVELVSLRDSRDRVVLDFRQDDLDFSAVARTVALEDWQVGLLKLRRDVLPGWYGESHARLIASVEVVREPMRSAPAIFIPLLASLFIPLLALWLERVDDNDFAIEAFELANIVIGGLFAVIALNFTILASYPALAGSDNTVTRLFSLNYTTLAISAVANLVLFRFKLLKRWFGPHVPVVLYEFLVWAMPLLVLAVAAATLLIAWV